MLSLVICKATHSIQFLLANVPLVFETMIIVFRRLSLLNGCYYDF